MKILQFATTWIDLEDIMHGEISQTEKDKSLIQGMENNTTNL